MIKGLLGRQINSITIAAVLIATSSLVSRFLGIFRDHILAKQFGAGNFLDIYYAAFRIPDLIFNLLVLGALSAGFIPIFSGLIRDMQCDKASCQAGSENNKAWFLVNNILNILILTLIVISLLGIVFSPFLIKLIAPGFSPDLQKMTSDVSRIMFLSPIFLGISSIFSGILQSFKRFFIYSLAPVVYNIGIILGALILVPIWGVYGLAWGVVLGAFLHMFIQIPVVLRLGFRYKPVLDIRDKYVIRLVKMMVPRAMSLGVSQVNLLVITAIASGLVSGSLTIFNFANNLQFFPIGIFGISFAIAAFPTMSRLASDNDKLIKSFSNTFRQILFFIVPSTVLFITLRAQITRIILGSGKFDWEDTVLTMDTLGFFAISLFAQATIPLLVRVYYTKHNSRTPFLMSLFSVIINIIISLILAGRMGVDGLALAFSISSIINFCLLWLFLHFALGRLDEAKILASAFKFSLSAIVAGLVIQASKGIVGNLVDMSKVWGVFTQGFVVGILGILVYLLCCLLLKSEEFFDFYNSIKRRIFKVKLKDRISTIENI